MKLRIDKPKIKNIYKIRRKIKKTKKWQREILALILTTSTYGTDVRTVDYKRYNE